MRIVGYTYDADVHCDTDAYDAFGDELFDEVNPVADSEGNEVQPIFSTDEDTYFDHCGDCGEALHEHDELEHDMQRYHEDGSTISDLSARRIAADWHDGTIPGLISLSSTGAIVPGVVEEIKDDQAYHGIDPSERERLAALLDYVEAKGERGPQAGWSDLNW